MNAVSTSTDGISGAFSTTNAACWTSCRCRVLMPPIECRMRVPTSKLASIVAFCDKSSSTVARSRSEEHTSELQSLMRISYAVFCLKKKTDTHKMYEESNIVKE